MRFSKTAFTDSWYLGIISDGLPLAIAPKHLMAPINRKHIRKKVEKVKQNSLREKVYIKILNLCQNFGWCPLQM